MKESDVTLVNVSTHQRAIAGSGRRRRHRGRAAELGAGASRRWPDQAVYPVADVRAHLRSGVRQSKSLANGGRLVKFVKDGIGIERFVTTRPIRKRW